MSHGAESDIAEPTPLLDLLLQQTAFLLIMVSFVAGPLAQSIQRSEGAVCVAMELKRPIILVLHVDADGALLERSEDGDETKLDSPPRISGYLRDLYNYYKELKGEKGVKEMTIIVRRHNTAFDRAHRVMKAARDAGFVNVDLRDAREW
jgi:biopolymer transport protein ExbD